MEKICYIDRQSGKIEVEEVFGESAVRLLYGQSFLSKTIGKLVLHLFAKWSFFSRIYGWLQTRPSSRKKILPFVKRFDIDVSEFEKPIERFSSFNDFFIRGLQPTARPIASSAAVIPADGRYRFYPEVRKTDRFSVKKQPFCLESVLKNAELADRFDGGTLIIARLCPTDCHRFYFPIDCLPAESQVINGKLFSVNTIAITNNPWIWAENKRVLTPLASKEFGSVLFMEVGATNVGSIIQTYTPHSPYKKGSEKGFFSFGGSALLIFFERGRIILDADLIGHDKEVRCLIGQSLGIVQ